MLIVKPDAVGDFILVRNFLPYIRQSARFRDYRITWCGNALHRKLIEQFDPGLFDDYIWIEKTRIYWDIFYYLRTAKSLYKQYEVAIHPVFSRELLFDFFVKISGVNERIGLPGDTININPAYHRMAGKWYTEMLQVDASVVFEFYKNQAFFENLLREKLPVLHPGFDPVLVRQISLPSLPDSFVVLFPGAQMSFRRWAPENFAAICDFVKTTYHLEVIIAGSKQDMKLAEKIIGCSKTRPVSLAGETTFSQLIGVIAKSNLVITNDTAAAHIAPAVNVPVIALSQMNHYGRFLPYPEEMGINMICVIPPGYDEVPKEQLVEQFKPGSFVSINLITTGQVERAIEQILRV